MIQIDGMELALLASWACYDQTSFGVLVTMEEDDGG